MRTRVPRRAQRARKNRGHNVIDEEQSAQLAELRELARAADREVLVELIAEQCAEDAAFHARVLRRLAADPVQVFEAHRSTYQEAFARGTDRSGFIDARDESICYAALTGMTSCAQDALGRGLPDAAFAMAEYAVREVNVLCEESEEGWEASDVSKQAQDILAECVEAFARLEDAEERLAWGRRIAELAADRQLTLLGDNRALFEIALTLAEEENRDVLLRAALVASSGPAPDVRWRVDAALKEKRETGKVKALRKKSREPSPLLLEVRAEPWRIFFEGDSLYYDYPEEVTAIAEQVIRSDFADASSRSRYRVLAHHIEQLAEFGAKERALAILAELLKTNGGRRPALEDELSMAKRRIEALDA